MLIKITANANDLVFSSETVIDANQIAIFHLGAENHVQVNPTTNKIEKVYLSKNGNGHNVASIGTTSSTVSRIQLGNVTSNGKFHTVVDSL